MINKTLPFGLQDLHELARSFPTPFHIYDEKGIRANARRLHEAFRWNHGFKEFFAVKATPNPSIIQLLHEEGCGADCSSLAELVLCERIGITDEDVMFTSNNTAIHEYRKAIDLRAIVNLDDISHIDLLERHTGFPEIVSLRYNPGGLALGNAIIGNPQESKYGFTRAQVFDGYKRLLDRGVKRFGLHAMVASNELSEDFFEENARMLFRLAVDVVDQTGVSLELINLGGGIGIPYRPDQVPIDIVRLAGRIYKRYEELIAKNIGRVKICLECGRFMTGPFGYLVTKAIHKKAIYKNYVGVDACMANLMRPGMYGAYHHITVAGKNEHGPIRTVDVVGSLCENNDKFAIDRLLPEIDIGDYLVIHDTGAHGHAMGFQYNGKLRSAELLLKEDGSVVQIRRAETLDDYFATLDFAGVSGKLGAPHPADRSQKPGTTRLISTVRST
jgi:diaminopimelate decarboxylase